MTQKLIRIRSTLPAAFLALLALLFCLAPAAAEPRLALVIGNGKYGKEIGSLINPPNDANLVADSLAKLGFKVTKLVNGDQKAMKRAISTFGQALSAAGPEAVGLFFYAGHGIQVDGTNYLIPVGAAIAAEADVDLEAVSAETVLKQMEYAGARVNIVILDACRNNPLPRSMRGADRGLARMDAPAGSFIGYSTSPGDVANDGDGKNSPYTAALVSEMSKPGVAIEEAFRNVRVKVMQTTSKQQVPWDSSSLTGAFYFNEQQAAPAAVAAAAPAAKPIANAAKEKAYWDGIKDSKDADDYQAYLAKFPDGLYADVARDKLDRYGGKVKTAAAAPDSQPAAQQQAERSPEPAAEPETQVASLPAADAEPAPQPSNAGDGLLLSAKVSGQLKAYLSQLQNRNGAFAVSPDGRFSGSFTCEEVGQCIPGKKGQRQNTDPRFPRNAALQKCASVSKQECVIVLIRGEQKQPYSLASE
ncbi:caspase family protein [Dongia rigui]|uniref:Caspase family protein n=1 Tax=Dongia rigui TaxID=940149 RepID=A0ABU5DUR6_9PROT|nr:caspase family protein [Dongia rigui]MDY0871032.1 caspase family protein [Dongia rigui]